MVLAVDEKSQMQAMDRTAAVLPMMPAPPARQTHDYVRHGTTSLFAGLDIATARSAGRPVLARCRRPEEGVDPGDRRQVP
jgi:hypothetical protein